MSEKKRSAAKPTRTPSKRGERVALSVPDIVGAGVGAAASTAIATHSPLLAALVGAGAVVTSTAAKETIMSVLRPLHGESGEISAIQLASFEGFWAQSLGAIKDELDEQKRKLDETKESLDERVKRELADPQVKIVAWLYSQAAFREALEERRVMLAEATRSLVALDVTIANKARLERVLRELDPPSVLELYRLSRAEGRFRRRDDGRALVFSSTGELVSDELAMSDVSDVLIATSCIRESIEPHGLGGAGGGGHIAPSAYVTERGHLVLRTLRRYIATRVDPFCGPGREEIRGSRSEAEARAIIASSGIMQHLRGAIGVLRGVERWPQINFEYAVPARSRGRSSEGRLVDFEEIDPRAPCILFLGAVPPIAAATVTVEPGELSVAREDLPHFGTRDAQNVRIHGAYDVLRWIADDVGARWSPKSS